MYYSHVAPVPQSPTFLRRIPAVLGVVQRPVKALMDLLHAGKGKSGESVNAVKSGNSVKSSTESILSLKSLSLSSIDESDIEEALSDVSDISDIQCVDETFDDVSDVFTKIDDLHELSLMNEKAFDIIDMIERSEPEVQVVVDSQARQANDEDRDAWNNYYEYNYVPKKHIWNYATTIDPVDIEMGLGRCEQVAF